MEVTWLTMVVAIGGLVIMGVLGSVQVVALLRPRAAWTVANVYGGDPGVTDPTAYFAHNQGYAWADVILWAPVQVAGSVGMLLGERWGFVAALAASVPYVYTAVNFFVWDRDLGFRQPTFAYWVGIWGIWPAFGVLQGAYCWVRLLG